MSPEAQENFSEFYIAKLQATNQRIKEKDQALEAMKQEEREIDQALEAMKQEEREIDQALEAANQRLAREKAGYEAAIKGFIANLPKFIAQCQDTIAKGNRLSPEQVELLQYALRLGEQTNLMPTIKKLLNQK